MVLRQATQYKQIHAGDRRDEAPRTGQGKRTFSRFSEHWGQGLATSQGSTTGSRNRVHASGVERSRSSLERHHLAAGRQGA